MIVTELGTSPGGARNVEIRCNEIPFHALLRCLRRLPGALVSGAVKNPMNDDAQALIRYKNIAIQLETPFSDYVLSCESPGHEFDEVLDHLRSYKTQWWERFF